MNITVNDAYLCGLGFSKYLCSTDSGPLSVTLSHEDYSYFKDKIDVDRWEPSLVNHDGVFLYSKEGTLSSLLEIIANEESESGNNIFFHFLAGLIRKNGLWNKTEFFDYLLVAIYHPALKAKIDKYNPEYHTDNFGIQVNSFSLSGLGLTDVFGEMISKVSLNMVDEDCLCKYYSHVGTFRHDGRIVGFSWSKIKPEGQAPAKHHSSDSGFDITLVREVSRHGNLTFFGTGIGVTTAHGWYFQLVPRSSLAKRGYMLANSVGIIDQGYSGEIMAPLIKIDPEAQPLTLPCRCLQIVPAPVVHFNFPEVTSLKITARNQGGFGSTGL